MTTYLPSDNFVSKHSIHLRDSTHFTDIGNAGTLIESKFNNIKRIPGWFNVDDCSHFHLILSYQTLMGVTGDMFEIGSYFGRSASLMATYLMGGERFFICDAFESDIEDVNYQNRPTPEILKNNICRSNPRIKDEQLEIYSCYSNDLQFHEKQQFRFIHIDGGHSSQQVYSDLDLCSKHLLPNGIIVVDDYDH